MVNELFSSYYTILVVILAVMVPVWFGRFVVEAVATIRWRRRERTTRRAGS